MLTVSNCVFVKGLALRVVLGYGGTLEALWEVVMPLWYAPEEDNGVLIPLPLSPSASWLIR